MERFLSARLNSLRGKRTKSAFSKLLGIPYTSYCDYEKGIRSPDSQTLTAICRTLDISADWLLGLSATPTAPGLILHEEPAGYETVKTAETVFHERAICAEAKAAQLQEEIKRLRAMHKEEVATLRELLQDLTKALSQQKAPREKP